MIESCVYYTAFCVLVLLVWFDSSAFEEYASLFKLDFWFDLSTLESKRNSDPELGYPDFLVMYHNNYFTRLLSCPLCITIWFHIFSYFHHRSFEVSVISAFFSILFYNNMKKGYDE